MNAHGVTTVVLAAGGLSAAALLSLRSSHRPACPTAGTPVAVSPRTGSATGQSWDPPAIDIAPPEAPSAKSGWTLHCLLFAGERLFQARFTRADGAGRPAATGDSKPTIRSRTQDPGLLRTAGPDANSCAGCHNQPVVGGAGDFAVNVFVGAQFSDPPVRSVNFEVTSERQTPSLFGVGVIELLAREMTQTLHALRDSALAQAVRSGVEARVALQAKGVSFGTLIGRPDGSYDAALLEGVDPDLVIKPFGAKGVVISIREFTINALNHHHGIQAIERFGWERTGRRDFDLDGVTPEFSIGQTTAVALFQASLPVPAMPKAGSTAEKAIRERGRRAFDAARCTACHVPALALDQASFSEPNPYNRPGNLLPGDTPNPISFPLSVGREGSGLYRGADGQVYVAALTDLKRHRICDQSDAFLCNERLRQDNVPTDQFMTAKLWDAGSTSPYCHRGNCSTISEAILHHAGEAAESRARFLALSEGDKIATIAYLLAHRVPMGAVQIYK